MYAATLQSILLNWIVSEEQYMNRYSTAPVRDVARYWW
jgi:hypothetical protein